MASRESLWDDSGQMSRAPRRLIESRSSRPEAEDPPRCRYQPRCPGCPRFGRVGFDPGSWAELERVARAYNHPLDAVEAHSCEGWGHRHRARLSVRGRPGDVRMGIFEAGSHRLVHIPECPIHHPAIAELLPLLITWLNRAQIEPYREGEHEGLLRAVQLAVEPRTQRVQVVLLVRDSLADAATRVARFLPLWEEQQARLSGLFLGALPDVGNSLMAARIVQVGGDAMISDVVGGAQVFFPPDAFGQANPVLHSRAVEAIHEWVEPDSEVVEYYAGVGTIGLGLRRSARSLTMNECAPGSLRALRAAVQEHAADVVIEEGTAGDKAQLYGEAATVIVDPPRKGLDRPLFERLRSSPPRRLIYLSCGLAAFAREARGWAESDTFVLRHLSGWAYFPFTTHIETLAIFDRASM